MDELISRNEAIKWFFRPYSNEESYSNLDVERALKAIPAVDAVPVVHARWIAETPNTYTREVYCSNCRSSAPFVAKSGNDDPIYFRLHGEFEITNYCPTCGAKMDGE